MEFEFEVGKGKFIYIETDDDYKIKRTSTQRFKVVKK